MMGQERGTQGDPVSDTAETSHEPPQGGGAEGLGQPFKHGEVMSWPAPGQSQLGESCGLMSMRVHTPTHTARRKPRARYTHTQPEGRHRLVSDTHTARRRPWACDTHTHLHSWKGGAHNGTTEL